MATRSVERQKGCTGRGTPRLRRVVEGRDTRVDLAARWRTGRDKRSDLVLAFGVMVLKIAGLANGANASKRGGKGQAWKSGKDRALLAPIVLQLQLQPRGNRFGISVLLDIACWRAREERRPMHVQSIREARE